MEVSVKDRQLWNHLTPDMRVYVLYVLTHDRKKEIRCEKCGRWDQLEFHHEKYFPEEEVTVNDITLLCSKCHRNSDKSQSMLRTEFAEGKRFCVTNHYRFEY